MSGEPQPSGWWVAAICGWDESDSTVGVGFDPVAPTVDHHVMVEPTQRHQIVWVVVAAVTVGNDMVGLEPVGGSASRCSTGAVAPQHEIPHPADTAGCGPWSPPDGHL